MLNYQNEYFLQSAPFKILWAGFESDTLRLQNNGWTLAVEDRCDFALARHEVRFILRHEMLNLYAFTYVNSFEFSDLTDYLIHSKEHLRFNIQVIGKDIMYTAIPDFSFDCIKEIDCRPEYIALEQKRISELSIFKTLIKPDNALIIEPHRIGELLQQIVDAQAPNQKEIRERMRKSDVRSAVKQTLHAQILTIAA